MQSIDQIFSDAQEAINHVDDVLARKILKNIDEILTRQRAGLDPRSYSQLVDLQTKLKLVNLPNLSEQEAVEMLRSHYLESFAIGIEMENRITALLFFYPEIPRDDLRKKLKNALLQNQQRIGNLTISQWIIEFEKMFNVKTRDLSASVHFAIEHPQARNLSPIEREKLKDVLHVYDYLLVSTLPATGPILEQILEASNSLAESRDAFNPQTIRTKENYLTERRYSSSEVETKAAATVQMPLKDALVKYPNLGEQNVTSTSLNLKFLPTPVRPSIKNWINDYQDEVGTGKRSPVDRSNYLFQSPNGLKLSADERQKMSLLFKSLDEGTELTIDPIAQMVVIGGQQALNQESGIKNQESDIRNQEARIINHEIRNQDLRIRNQESLRNQEPAEDIFEKLDRVEKFGSFASTRANTAPMSNNAAAPRAAVIRPNMYAAQRPAASQEEMKSSISAPQAGAASEQKNNVQSRPLSPNFAKQGGYRIVSHKNSQSALKQLGAFVSARPKAEPVQAPSHAQVEFSNKNASTSLPKETQAPFKSVLGSDDYFMDKQTEDDGASISFSSPQKLAAEQKTPSVSKPNYRSPYVIRSSKRFPNDKNK